MSEAPQTLAVKRAQVEFHNFASLGEPDRVLPHYLDENQRRGLIIETHRDFIGTMTPFLEIGANAGHTSYMLANQFGGEGFALDISADALRHGVALQQLWNLERAPFRVAGDAVALPFRDNSVRFVMACQMLSQFMDIEAVFLEVKRVLMPGGVFLFTEEPLRRKLSLRLYRAPYQNRMRPWERTLFDWGLLGYLVRDVIGAEQEESFGIRQNHRMYMDDWHRLITKHFAAHRYQCFIPERGWGERLAKRAALSEHRAALWLGGTLTGMCRKSGDAPKASKPPDFTTLLRCPECHGELVRDASGTLRSMCGYSAANEGGVYNLLPARLRAELYPGDRDDAVDFTLPGHVARLGEGWYELEEAGVGNKYRWIGERARAVLRPVTSGPQRMRVRGFAHEAQFAAGQPAIELSANGVVVAKRNIERVGLFVIEADLPDAPEYRVEIASSPTWSVPEDDRVMSVNISMLRLVGPE